MTLNSLVRDDELHTRTEAERASVLRPFHQFARWQASGALLLLVCAVGALVWANSPWAIAYEQMLHAPLRLSLGERVLQLDLRDRINDGLMAIFFFAVGLPMVRQQFNERTISGHPGPIPMMGRAGCRLAKPGRCFAGRA